MEAKHVRITDAQWETIRTQFSEHHHIADMPDGTSDYVMCVCDECDMFRRWWVTTQWAEYYNVHIAQNSLRALAQSFVEHLQSGKDPQEWIEQQHAAGHEIVAKEVGLDDVPRGMYL